MEFTRTPFGANSNARSLVNLSWAALTTPYAMNAGDWGMIAATDDMLTTDPCSHQSFHSIVQDLKYESETIDARDSQWIIFHLRAGAPTWAACDQGSRHCNFFPSYMFPNLIDPGENKHLQP